MTRPPTWATSARCAAAVTPVLNCTIASTTRLGWRAASVPIRGSSVAEEPAASDAGAATGAVSGLPTTDRAMITPTVSTADATSADIQRMRSTIPIVGLIQDNLRVAKSFARLAAGLPHPRPLALRPRLATGLP